MDETGKSGHTVRRPPSMPSVPPTCDCFDYDALLTSPGICGQCYVPGGDM